MSDPKLNEETLYVVVDGDELVGAYEPDGKGDHTVVHLAGTVARAELSHAQRGGPVFPFAPVTSAASKPQSFRGAAIVPLTRKRPKHVSTASPAAITIPDPEQKERRYKFVLFVIAALTIVVMGINLLLAVYTRLLSYDAFVGISAGGLMVYLGCLSFLGLLLQSTKLAWGVVMSFTIPFALVATTVWCGHH